MAIGRISVHELSACLAIAGTVGYHSFVKKIPVNTDPMVSIIGIYLGVLLLGLCAMPFVYAQANIMESVRQLGWVQLGIALCIFGMEVGFILMYRSGWDVSVGNVVTGVFVNMALVVIGMVLFREHLAAVNLLGIGLCLAGVAMVQYRCA